MRWLSKRKTASGLEVVCRNVTSGVGGFPLECAVWKVVEVVLLVSCGGKEALVVVRGRGVVWERRRQGRVWTGLAASGEARRTAIWVRRSEDNLQICILYYVYSV
jgi:hypothetical protein